MNAIRLHLPLGEPHMFLLDGDEVLAEIWDYRLRASIESGETDLKSCKMTLAQWEKLLQYEKYQD